jgi:hypothetical protein
MERGRHGGTEGGEGFVDAGGWFQLIDAPEEVAPLINAALLLADADIAGFARNFLSKVVRGIGQAVIRKELQLAAREAIERNLAKVRTQLNRSKKYRSLSNAEKQKILKRVDSALEHEYYKKAAAEFKRRADEYEGIISAHVDEASEAHRYALEVARENRDAFREMERAARANAREAMDAAAQARKMEKYAEKRAGAAKKHFDEARDAARTEGKVQGAGALEWTNRRKQVVVFEGYEVRSVRDLSHMPDDKIRDMASSGRAAFDKNGVPLQIHHLDQNPKGPFMEIAKDKHDVFNPKQHPHGNQAGAGIGDEARQDFDAWRQRYWMARGRDEMARRGLK